MLIAPILKLCMTCMTKCLRDQTSEKKNWERTSLSYKLFMALKKKSKNKNKIPVESKTTKIQVKGKEKVV